MFFRQSLKSVAIKNNICGWVKNLDDGSVEAVLEGRNYSIDRVVSWAHTGPANSRVDSVIVTNEIHTGEFSRFDVLY